MKHKRTFSGVIFTFIALLAAAGCSKTPDGSCEADTGLHKADATRYYCWTLGCVQYTWEETEESYQESFDGCVAYLTDREHQAQRYQTNDNCLFDECVAMEGVYTLAGCETVTDECWDPTVTGGGDDTP
jgi:hypothetical protein